MSAWNELHFSRAQEFARLIADAITGQASAPPTQPVPAASILPHPSQVPVPAPRAIPAAAPAPAAPTPAPAAKPTAASVFNKIPWKK
jgi:hypothetical protein